MPTPQAAALTELESQEKHSLRAVRTAQGVGPSVMCDTCFNSLKWKKVF